MNPIIMLLRRFGSTESKIKAIEYDNQKLHDFLQRIQTVVVDYQHSH